jgi:hypothetical protein
VERVSVTGAGVEVHRENRPLVSMYGKQMRRFAEAVAAWAGTPEPDLSTLDGSAVLWVAC